MSSAKPTVGKSLAERRADIKTRKAVIAVGGQGQSQVFHNLRRLDPPTTIAFQLSPTHVSYANTLRRIMITEVETVGFRADILPDGTTADVKIMKNCTPMSNEMLAHRIGLLPIHIANPLAWNPDDYSFKLEITNDSGEPRDIVASDIQVLKNRGPEEDPLPVPSVQFFHPDPVTHETTLLTVLKGKVGMQEPESLAFTARATVGKGRENARFMPVTSRCAYGYTLDDDEERKKEIFAKWLDNTKKVSLASLESTPGKKEELEREFKTMEIQRCYKINEQGEPYSFDFTVESVGVLDPVYIVQRALQIIQEKLLKYASIDSGDLPANLKMQPAEARGALFDFIFEGEDHTLGNLLQTWMDQTMMDKEIITFVGYKVPHPLRDEMLLRVGVTDGKSTRAREVVAQACRECAQLFKYWSENWAVVSTSLLA